MNFDNQSLRMTQQYHRDIEAESNKIKQHYQRMGREIKTINSGLKETAVHMGKWLKDSSNVDFSPIHRGLEGIVRMKVPVLGFFSEWILNFDRINRDLKEFESTFVKASASFARSGDRIAQVQKHWQEASATMAELTGSLHVSEEAFRSLAGSMNQMGHNYEVFNAAITESDEKVSILSATIQFAQATGQEYTSVLKDMTDTMLNFGASSTNAATAMQGVHRGFMMITSAAAQTGLPISYVQEQVMQATKGFETHAISVGSAVGGVAETFANVFMQARDQLGKQGMAKDLTQKLVGGMANMDLGMQAVIGESMGLGPGTMGLAKFGVLRDMDMYGALQGSMDWLTSTFGSGADKSFHTLVGEGLMNALPEAERQELARLAPAGASGRQLLRTYTDQMDGQLDSDLMKRINLDQGSVDRSLQGALMIQKMFGVNFREAQEIQDLQLKEKAGTLSDEDQKRYNDLMKSSRDIQDEQLTFLRKISMDLAAFLGGPGGIANIAKSFAGGLVGFLGTILLEHFDILEGDTLGQMLPAGAANFISESLDKIPGMDTIRDMATGLADSFGGIKGMGDLYGRLKDAVKGGFTDTAAVIGDMWNKIKASGFFDQATDLFKGLWGTMRDIGAAINAGFKLLMEKSAMATRVMGDTLLVVAESIVRALDVITGGKMAGIADTISASRGILHKSLGSYGFSVPGFSSQEEASSTRRRLHKSGALGAIDDILAMDLADPEFSTGWGDLYKSYKVAGGGYKGLSMVAATLFAEGATTLKGRGVMKDARDRLGETDLNDEDKAFAMMLATLKANGAGAESTMQIQAMLNKLSPDSVFKGQDPMAIVSMLEGGSASRALFAGGNRAEQRMRGAAYQEKAFTRMEELWDTTKDVGGQVWDATKGIGGTVLRSIPSLASLGTRAGYSLYKRIIAGLESRGSGDINAVGDPTSGGRALGRYQFKPSTILDMLQREDAYGGGIKDLLSVSDEDMEKLSGMSGEQLTAYFSPRIKGRENIQEKLMDAYTANRMKTLGAGATLEDLASRHHGARGGADAEYRKRFRDMFTELGGDPDKPREVVVVADKSKEAAAAEPLKVVQTCPECKREMLGKATEHAHRAASGASTFGAVASGPAPMPMMPNAV